MSEIILITAKLGDKQSKLFDELLPLLPITAMGLFYLAK
jgi:hypothetical protein